MPPALRPPGARPSTRRPRPQPAAKGRAQPGPRGGQGPPGPAALTSPSPGHRPLAPSSWAPEAASSRYPPPLGTFGLGRCPSPEGLPGRRDPSRPGPRPGFPLGDPRGQARPLPSALRVRRGHGPGPPSPGLRLRGSPHSRFGPGKYLCPQPSRPDTRAWPRRLSPHPTPIPSGGYLRETPARSLGFGRGREGRERRERRQAAL